MAGWIDMGRKKNRIAFADKHVINFWKDNPGAITPKTKYTLEFPTPQLQKQYEAEMQENRDRINKELGDIRMRTALKIYGGDSVKPRGWTLKQGTEDAIMRQERHWLKVITATSKKYGGTVKKV